MLRGGAVIESRAPLRLSLAGGGSDLLDNTHKKGAVLSMALDLYTQVWLSHSDKGVCYLSIDQNKLGCDFLVEESNSSWKAIARAVVRFFEEKYSPRKALSVNIAFRSPVLMGSGLGGSSSLTVALIQAFFVYFGIRPTGALLSETAFYIERKVLGLKGGLQDMYACSHAGLNLLEFEESSVHVTPLLIEDSSELHKFLTQDLYLKHTGVQRNSSDLVKSVGSGCLFERKEELAEMAYCAYNALRQDEFGNALETFNKAWHVKRQNKQQCPSFIVAQADALKEKGAYFVKLAGAGAGGYLVYASSRSVEELAVALKVSLTGPSFIVKKNKLRF